MVTSHGQLGDTGKPTGWYLPEVAHPYHVFKAAGYTCDFVSPKGGKAPMVSGGGGEGGDTGEPTGWYLPEVAHPYHVFEAAGYTCDFVSPKGGKAPLVSGAGVGGGRGGTRAS